MPLFLRTCLALQLLAVSQFTYANDVNHPTIDTGMPALTTQWWQWAMSDLTEKNPVRDLTGEHCSVNQQGNVWFLAGGFGSSKIVRNCTIPQGKALFFPLVNMVYWPQKNANSYTCSEAKASAALNNETAVDLFAEVDGVPIQNLKQQRVSSDECFDIFKRVPKEQKPYNAYPSASDGYWVFIPPMPAGQHTLKFGGRYNRESNAYGRMLQDIEYRITVE